MLYINMQWFTMKRQHAIVIMADSLYFRKFREHCKVIKVYFMNNASIHLNKMN